MSCTSTAQRCAWAMQKPTGVPSLDGQQTTRQRALAWARMHPDAQGILELCEWRQGKRFRQRFVVQSGRVAPLRRSGQQSNGRCARCGSVTDEPLLALCWAPDPRAGEPWESDYARWAQRTLGGQTVHARMAQMWLCPDCRKGCGDRDTQYRREIGEIVVVYGGVDQDVADFNWEDMQK